MADPYTGLRSEEMTQKNKRIQDLEKENRELKRQLDNRCDNICSLIDKGSQHTHSPVTGGSLLVCKHSLLLYSFLEIIREQATVGETMLGCFSRRDRGLPSRRNLGKMFTPQLTSPIKICRGVLFGGFTCWIDNNGLSF